MSLDVAADIVLLLCAAIAAGGAYVFHSRGKRAAAVTCVLVVAISLRLHVGRDRYLHAWDERYHVLVAKNLVSDPLRPALYAAVPLPYDFRDPFANHVWLHKPPLALWLMAASMRLFGANEAAARLPSLVVSSLAVLATYGIGRTLFEESVAVLAAGLLAVNGFVLDLAGGRVADDHVDTLLIGLVVLGCWMSFRYTSRPTWWRVVAIGVCTGLAVLTKSLVALLIPLVWLAVVWPLNARGTVLSRLGVILMVAAFVSVPWEIFTRASYPKEAAWEASYIFRHLVEPLQGHAGPWYEYLVGLGRFHGELVYIPIAWFVIVNGAGRFRAWGLLAWLAVPYLVFSAAETKMPAYVSVAAPAVCLIAAAFWCHLDRRAKTWKDEQGKRLLAAALLGLLLVLPLRYTAERLRVLHPKLEREPAWARDLKAISLTLGQERAVIVNDPWFIETMFYTAALAYPQDLGASQAAELAQRGYHVYRLRGDMSLESLAQPGLSASNVRDR
jgi:4-amino-4-deoxy-L-arabinose transferase-like glycosyltransferase